MTQSEMLVIAASLVATMFGLLCAVLGWIGSRMFGKLDELVSLIGTVKDELHERISEYQESQNDRWNGIERRMSAVETRCTIYHQTAKD
jgi:hypothetical protein